MEGMQSELEATVPRCRVVWRTPADAPDHEYLIYRPRRLRSGASPMAFIHGYSRGVEEQVGHLRAIAEVSGRVLVAPVYARDRHPQYQCLKIGHRGMRSSDVLDACLDDFAALTGDAPGPVVLIGFSGGAQFAHRYLMARPERVVRLIAIAAGWYTLPDPVSRFPLGLQTGRRLKRYSFNPEEFLRVPMHVMVGAEDTNSLNVRMSEDIVRMQGVTRVERARRWVTLMRLAAESHGIRSDIHYREVPGIGHSFRDFVSNGQLLSLIAAALGDPVPEHPSTPSPAAPPTPAHRPAELCHGTA